MQHWFKTGEIKEKFDVMEGVDNPATALVRMLKGYNMGKALLKILVL
jgi:NADPH-dependent curcumin reductase CurA